MNFKTKPSVVEWFHFLNLLSIILWIIFIFMIPPHLSLEQFERKHGDEIRENQKSLAVEYKDYSNNKKLEKFRDGATILVICDLIFVAFIVSRSVIAYILNELLSILEEKVFAEEDDTT